jgi:hypothetical protein
VREVRGAIDGIENPAVPRRRPSRGRCAELLAEHVVIRVAVSNELTKRAFDREINLGDQVDDALLPHGKAAAEGVELHAAGAAHGVDGGGQKGRRDRSDFPGIRHGRRLAVRGSAIPGICGRR